jgi:ribonucleoside-diphosphate reductase alpha chain
VTIAQSFGSENKAHPERTAASPIPAPSAPAPSPASSQANGTANGTVAKASGPHSTAELIEFQQGRTADAPLCLTCGTKMRPAGSCYVCEGCGSTSGCS